MTAAELCAAYNKVARKHGLTQMAYAALQVETYDFDGPEAAWDALQKLEPTEGWLQFQSQVMTLPEALPEPDPNWGYLLAAEVIDDQGRSIHLRQSATGGMRLVLASPAEAADSKEAFLTDQVQYLATDKAPGAVCHRRYWRVDSALGVVPIFAAFQGFARDKDA